MRKNFSAMVSGRRKDAGYTFIEIIAVLGIVAVLAALGVVIFLTVFSNATASNATKVGIATQQAAFSYFTQYGSYPTSQSELETYLARSGDDVPSDTLPNNTRMTVGLDNTTTPSSPVVVIQSGEFNDAIVVRRAGAVENFPEKCGTDVTQILGDLDNDFTIEGGPDDFTCGGDDGGGGGDDGGGGGDDGGGDDDD